MVKIDSGKSTQICILHQYSRCQTYCLSAGNAPKTVRPPPMRTRFKPDTCKPISSHFNYHLVIFLHNIDHFIACKPIGARSQDSRFHLSRSALNHSLRPFDLTAALARRARWPLHQSPMLTTIYRPSINRFLQNTRTVHTISTSRSI